MLYREIIGVSSEIHARHIYTPSAERIILNVKKLVVKVKVKQSLYGPMGDQIGAEGSRELRLPGWW